MFDKLNELYQQTVLDHNRSPRNFRKLVDANRVGEGSNPSCGDRFTVFLNLENSIIQDIGFQGSGCAISKASASVMTELVKGKTVAEAAALFQKYQDMLKNDQVENDIAELRAFHGIRKFPMRVKCALLPWHGLMVALNAPK